MAQLARLAGVALAISVLCSCGVTALSPYSPEATETCLRAYGAKVTATDGDFIARTAIRGSAAVTIKGKRLSIAFALSSVGAETILLTDRQSGGVVGARLYKKNSAVLTWYDDPGSAKSIVDACLR